MSDHTPKMIFTGERFVPEEEGNIAIEHLHRYHSAVPLVVGKIVLDIACGEGYGSDLLASCAKRVYGVDAASVAIEHARKKYNRPNLKFKIGHCAKIPLPENSVDVIVSFETLEHYYQHEESMLEFKRVLRSGGLLIISSPDKKNYTDLRNYYNEFHVRELYEQEFRDLLARNFRYTKFFAQRVAYGSVLLPISEPTCSKSYLLKKGETVSSSGIVAPLYHLALASDDALGTIESGIFEQPLDETEVVVRLLDESERQVAKILRLEPFEQEVERLKHARDADKNELEDLRNALKNSQIRANNLETDMQKILRSNSWAITAPLRKARRLGAMVASTGVRLSSYDVVHRKRIVNGLNYLYRGDLQGLLRRIRQYFRGYRNDNAEKNIVYSTGRSWIVLTTPHTQFIAKCIVDRLASHGINSSLITEPPNDFNDDYYIVLCAQMFDRLPPGEKRIVFQLEQTVSSRWFTREYLSMLENSLVVLDYSLANVKFLADKGIAYPHVFYLPIGATPSANFSNVSIQKEYDFLFYGDYYSSPRRAKMIDALKGKFKVKICNNTFGHEMHTLIRKARFVVNIHYYENALLEMPRIQECLSQGVPVISESAQDQGDYPELGNAVRFFKEGSIDDMLRVAEQVLQMDTDFEQEVASSTAISQRRFNFMFDRFLAGRGFLPPETMLDRNIYLPSNQPQIALSLPETIDRRHLFLQTKPVDCTVFDGIRNVKGWIGCGLSYSALARDALRSGKTELMVFEDDVVFRDDHEGRLKIIRAFLDTVDSWDIFSGVMASVHHNTRVLDVQERNGLLFVVIDHMTSTVFNIYNRSGLELLAQWDPTNNDVQTNTIDRYLENQLNIKVVVALPFLVGHREQMMSTLWGTKNDVYSKMIAESEVKIRELADKWLLNTKNT